ncbi:MAG: hypothetical protein ACYS22_04620 [Planctomycetota bacterium]|jgi:hypothetical protein
MNRFAQTLTLALGLALGAGSAATASDYLPMTPSESAVYEGGFNGQETKTVEIDGLSGNWEHYDDFAGMGPVWLWTSSTTDRIYAWSFAAGTYQLLVDPAAGVGSRQQINLGNCNTGEVRIDAVGRTTTVKGGTFSDVIVLELTGNCNDAGTLEIHLAKGAGLIKWVEDSFTGPRTWELASGTIAGQTYPQATAAPGSLVVTGAVPHPLKWVNMMPSSSGPRPAPAVKTSITLDNQTGQDLRYRFNGSSLKVITNIYDTQGNLVASSVWGRAITRDLATITLPAGDSWHFDDEVTLKDSNG